jgi:alpha-amylase
MVSRRLRETAAASDGREVVERARQELYRGQCNCSYWHGAFGGIYLPHLRNAVYQHLIAAEKLLDEAEGRSGPWVEDTTDDYNFDAKQEIRLANDKLTALFAPAAGGQMYELDVHSICHNLLATLTRRPEAYHRKVLAGTDHGNADVASIHDRVVFKQADLDERLQYDHFPRKSLLDHFYDAEVTLASVARGEAAERGDFLSAVYEPTVRRKPERLQVLLTRSGHVEGVPVKITKGVTLEAGSSLLQIAYLLENLPQDRTLHFGVELNFAGRPAAAGDRYFAQGRGRLGHLGTQLDLIDMTELGLVDEWLGVDLRLTASCPTNFWTFPVESVSQSEGGFELVHQSVVVQPHWHVIGDHRGRWSVTLDLSIDTSRVENHEEDPAMMAAT